MRAGKFREGQKDGTLCADSRAAGTHPVVCESFQAGPRISVPLNFTGATGVILADATRVKLQLALLGPVPKIPREILSSVFSIFLLC